MKKLCVARGKAKGIYHFGTFLHVKWERPYVKAGNSFPKVGPIPLEE